MSLLETTLLIKLAFQGSDVAVTPSPALAASAALAASTQSASPSPAASASAPTSNAVAVIGLHSLISTPQSGTVWQQSEQW